MLLTSQLEGSGDRSKSIKTALELGTYALTWSSVMRAIDFGHHPLSPIAYVHTYVPERVISFPSWYRSTLTVHATAQKPLLHYVQYTPALEEGAK